MLMCLLNDAVLDDRIEQVVRDHGYAAMRKVRALVNVSQSYNLHQSTSSVWIVYIMRTKQGTCFSHILGLLANKRLLIPFSIV